MCKYEESYQNQKKIFEDKMKSSEGKYSKELTRLQQEILNYQQVVQAFQDNPILPSSGIPSSHNSNTEGISKTNASSTTACTTNSN